MKKSKVKKIIKEEVDKFLLEFGAFGTGQGISSPDDDSTKEQLLQLISSLEPTVQVLGNAVAELQGNNKWDENESTVMRAIKLAMELEELLGTIAQDLD
jgi:hypothetical protein